jgi:hypothetical protein
MGFSQLNLFMGFSNGSRDCRHPELRVRDLRGEYTWENTG